MNLIVDIGNYYIKLAVFQGDTVILRLKVAPKDAPVVVGNIVQDYPDIKQSIVAASGAIPEKLLLQLKKKLQVFVLDHHAKVPFNNLYATPETLGLDRIALVAAASNQYPGQNVLVIDAGTCITFDFLTDKNSYLGGAISPGLYMRYNALNHYTAGLPLLEPKSEFTLIGDSTVAAMHSGVLIGMIAEIEGFINRYKAQYADLTVILTGGDLLFLLDHLKNGIFANSNFLLEGLNYLLELNTLHD